MKILMIIFRMMVVVVLVMMVVMIISIDYYDYACAKQEPKAGRGRAGSKSEMPLESASPVQVEAEDAALLFFVVQFLLFMLLGSLVNRLRVAFGPPMMVLAAAVMGPRLVPVFLQRAFPKSLADASVTGVACTHVLDGKHAPVHHGGGRHMSAHGRQVFQ